RRHVTTAVDPIPEATWSWPAARARRLSPVADKRETGRKEEYARKRHQLQGGESPTAGAPEFFPLSGKGLLRKGSRSRDEERSEVLPWPTLTPWLVRAGNS